MKPLTQRKPSRSPPQRQPSTTIPHLFPFIYVSIAAFLLWIPLGIYIAPWLIPGWLVRAVRQGGVPDWSRPLDLIKTSISAIAIILAFLIPLGFLAGILPASISPISLATLRPASPPRGTAWIIAAGIIASITFIPALIRIYAETESLRESFQGGRIRSLILTTAYGRSLALFLLSTVGVIILIASLQFLMQAAGPPITIFESILTAYLHAAWLLLAAWSLRQNPHL